MIPTTLKTLFSAALRQRGDQYVADGAVRIAHATTNALIALVKGTSPYAVEVHAAPGQVVMSCTCPYAEEQGLCKHVWAVLSTADAERKLVPLLSTAGPRAQFFALPAAADVDELEHELIEGDTELRAAAPFVPAAPRDWKNVFELARQRMMYSRPPSPHRDAAPMAWPSDRRIVYVLDMSVTTGDVGIPIDIVTEKLRRDGSWEPMRSMRAPLATWLAAPDLIDRQIIQMLVGTGVAPRYEGGDHGPGAGTLRTIGLLLAPASFDVTLRLICSTGRCRVRLSRGERPTESVRWDDGPPWQFTLRVVDTDHDSLAVTGAYVRGEERLSAARPLVAHPSGLIVADGALARAEFGGAFPLLAALQERGALPLDAGDLPDLLATVFALPVIPPLELPDSHTVTESHAAPQPCLSIASEPRLYGGPVHWLTPAFRYGNMHIAPDSAGATLFDRDTLTIHRRDRTAETAALARLTELGVRSEYDYRTHKLRLVVKGSRIMTLVAVLSREGWLADAEGTRYRAFTGTRAAVRSGIDWFDLDAAAQYGDMEVSLHDLADAARRGQPGVVLPDGSVGLIPTDWLAKWKAVAAGGTPTGGITRFTRAQTLLLDALLASMPDVDVDAAFEHARAELHHFDRIVAVDPPPGFVGVLREYQREGLGWLHFLRQFQLGGCLADDMGLGKTIQVLALLEARRAERAANGPSIVVVPRSLVRNWILEAERFTPSLRLLDHSLPDREDSLVLDDVDLVVTTYGVLRREAATLAAIQFDYAILDEAQAIKNAGTASAKAARLLRARHRLAVTGTPIENSLEDLWSIFEFLNPGMLGGHSGFGRLVKALRPTDTTAEQAPNEEGAGPLLSRALRPVILRRTKQLVARELPERTEQTLEVELEPAQRKFYDAILQRYRASVFDRVDRVGIGRSRMHILEALLRLRQAACHPALVDPTRKAASSAKLDALVPALAELVSEGHKALVFSQFTSFLSLVRVSLDAAGIAYEYLDGKTRDRQSRIDRFQNDPSRAVFLISLKAGGQGLNLTAADYVYLLDPWWNPAVEAQAIDRSHRIGQTRPVIATRLVARGTIEEKILNLQAAKRALADAILSENPGALAAIGRQELEVLLA